MKKFDSILVYTPKTTTRLRFAFKFILTDVIGFGEVLFETNLQAYNTFEGCKINYSNHKIDDNCWIAPHQILFETGLRDQDIKVFGHNNTKAFFATNRNATLPFDLFAASFYLISRYEEYLPSIHDKYERFEAHESIAYKENFLKTPIVDKWALELKKHLQQNCSNLNLKKREFTYINTIDIDNAWAYKHKGLFRTIGAIFKDVFKNDFSNLIERFRVIFTGKLDAYDTYSYLLQLQKKYGVKSIYFFLFADYGEFDKNISIENKNFRKLIKGIADEAEVGIHPSYNSNYNNLKLELEIKNLGKVIKRDITKSRQHFLKVSFPKTFQNLIEIDVTDDYTLGYASEIGFRAGTCTPFLFYNIDLEIETKLRLHPFQIMDATLLYYMKLSIDESVKQTQQLIDEIKSVDGTFVSLWHNETLSDSKQWKGWRKVYEDMLEYLYANSKKI